MIKNKSSEDQSILALFGVAFGIVCWICYGIYDDDITIITANIIMLSTYLAYIGTAVYYRLVRR